MISRRDFARGAGAAALAVPAFHGPWRHNTAHAQNRPLRLGLTCDATGQYADSGQDELRGIRLAIDERNAAGGVLGRQISWITADTETNPDTAAKVARRFVVQDDCTILLGAIHSEVAKAITQVASPVGVIYFNTNSSSPSESREDCSRTKFVWDANGTNFAKATVTNAVSTLGKRWALLTNDYNWGHNASSSTRTLVLASGGRVVDNLTVPQNTRDFRPFLRRIREMNVDVVAAAVGGDDLKALREQVIELDLHNAPAWINSQQDWPDIWGQGGRIFGVFGTTWYHKLPLPGVADFVQRWAAAYGNGPVPVPGNVSYNGYMATRELFNAMDRAGSTNNIAIIKQLENLRIPARERMQHFDAFMNPLTHHLQQTIYLARSQKKPSDKTDLCEIVGWIEPKAAEDPAAEPLCRLVPYAAVPSVDS